MDPGEGPSYRVGVPEWLTIEVFDGEVPASGWLRGGEPLAASG